MDALIAALRAPHVSWRERHAVERVNHLVTTAIECWVGAVEDAFAGASALDVLEGDGTSC